MCFSLSLGFAHGSRQAVEVGMINYLWPSLTILFTILFNGQKANLLIVPGLILAFLGICWVLGGAQGLDIPEMYVNLRDNPLSCLLAFCGAIIWAAYCTVTSKMAADCNGINVFFMFTALLLWLSYIIGGHYTLHFNFTVTAFLLLAACAAAFGYIAWNFGIMYGNMTLLATASYFTPVLSAALSIVILDVPISLAFWQGVMLVYLGSLLCGLSTRSKTPAVS